MRSVINEAGDVVLGHFWELLLEDAFQAGQDDEALVRPIVADHAELDITPALFEDGGLEFRHQSLFGAGALWGWSELES